MEAKKKNFFDNFRVKKLANLKKPGKKAAGKQGKKLAYRRSISVPDLRFVPGEAVSTENALLSTASDAICFGISSGLSDTDSIASGSITDGVFTTDNLPPLVPETRVRVPTENRTPAPNRASAPVGSWGLYEEVNDMMTSASDSKLDSTAEALYALPDKRTGRRGAVFSFDPLPAPRSAFAYAHSSSPRPDLADRLSLSGERACSAEDTPADIASSGMARAQSLGDQTCTYQQHMTPSLEYGKVSPGKGTPPALRPKALKIDTQAKPLESGDGTSQDSCGTPSEERVNLPWMAELEGLDLEDCLLEGAQAEEAAEEIEVSHMNS